MQIYVSKAGLRYGPYSLEELQQQLDGKVFNDEDFASLDESKSWIRIAEIPGIERGFAVEIDRAKNLLTIRYRGRVNAFAVERCHERVRAALRELTGDFHLLVDLIELEAMEIACAPHIKRIMQLCAEKGVSAVVRVIPDPKRDIGLQIMSPFHYGAEVYIATCASMAEALERLSTLGGEAAAPGEVEFG